MSITIPYEHLPTEILGLIESYLAPSDCAHLSATSTPLHHRWTARRWQRTFRLHYGHRSQMRTRERLVNLRNCRKRVLKLKRRLIIIRRSSSRDEEKCMPLLRLGNDNCNITANNECATNNADATFTKYDEYYRDGWEFTFVGCCHDQQYDFCLKCKYPVRSTLASSSSCCERINCKNNNNNEQDDVDDDAVDSVREEGAIRSSHHRSQTMQSRNNSNSNSNNINSHHSNDYDASHQYQYNIHQEDSYDDMSSALTTQFNVTALVPSVRRLYVDLWDTIELSLLGYYDADENTPTTTTTTTNRTPNRFLHHPTHHSQYPVPMIMRILRNSVLPELAEYLYFVVGFKPLALASTVRRVGGVNGRRWGSDADADTAAVARRRRRRRGDGGVMGPMLSRGLGGVRLGLDYRQQQQQQQRRQQQQQVGIESLPSSPSPPASNNAQGNEGINSRPSLEFAKTEISESHEIDEGESSNAQAIGPTTTLEEINSLRDAATTMSAWKLACFLRQRGVGCLRCAICDRIDLMGDDVEEDDCVRSSSSSSSTTFLDGMRPDEGEEDDGGDDEMIPGVGSTRNNNNNNGNNPRNDRHETSGRSPFLREFQKQVGGGDAWMTPCQCPELVHRQCLERKLKLVPKYEPWERFKQSFGTVYEILHTSLSRTKGSVERGTVLHRRQTHLTELDIRSQENIAPRVWISYDNALLLRGGHDAEDENDIIAVDRLGQFRSSAASCETCGGKFLRTVRLPRSKREVLAASLSDPISVMRAASTFVHFVLACAFLAACEGMCSDDSCDSHRTLVTTPLGALKWPTTGLNGFALAWWQLQQCCMLHIFFSRRFAAIVDRLWMGPISLFYCRLYFYFIVTSALLAASYIPMVSRTIRINFLEPFLSPWILEAVFQPIGDAIGFLNLFQYAVVSTTVVCIFWRTNYRIFTVADGKEAAATLRRREELLRNMQGVVGQEGHAGQNIDRGQDVAANHPDPVAINALPMQRIVGVGAGDDNAANHPIYHGPW